jgi:hypothetical protein
MRESSGAQTKDPKFAPWRQKRNNDLVKNLMETWARCTRGYQAGNRPATRDDSAQKNTSHSKMKQTGRHLVPKIPAGDEK